MDLNTYSKNISNFIAGSYITSAITLGKDLGLFDELKRLDKPVSSQQLADACSLKERYVRKWLGCMVSTRIVSLDDSDRYFIPGKLKPGLRGIDSAFFFPVLGYEFGDMLPEVVDVTEERVADPDMVVEQLLVPATKFTGARTSILDLGSGAGNISRALSRRFPCADIYGVDYTDMAITKAIEIAHTQGIKNVKFLKENATSLPADWTHKFDWVVMYDVLHDLSDPVNAMKEVNRVLKDNGVVSITDPDVHSNHRDNIGDPNVAGVGYALSTVICLPCSLSIDGAPGYGIGWGTENKDAFLKSSGWLVKDKRHIGSPLACNFTCVKA
ncbi:uncharacterized protein LOC117344165 [Pecten maximus]|uniref:uncharacterized protein LOC117344165 n=1 Tax=Pecten maximus TaxID=6579 RepID=UPI001458918D|nr:uncharacterized protein LOC117344165 [Pecten maximus]